MKFLRRSWPEDPKLPQATAISNMKKDGSGLTSSATVIPAKWLRSAYVIPSKFNLATSQPWMRKRSCGKFANHSKKARNFLRHETSESEHLNKPAQRESISLQSTCDLGLSSAVKQCSAWKSQILTWVVRALTDPESPLAWRPADP